MSEVSFLPALAMPKQTAAAEKSEANNNDGSQSEFESILNSSIEEQANKSESSSSKATSEIRNEATSAEEKADATDEPSEINTPVLAADNAAPVAEAANETKNPIEPIVAVIPISQLIQDLQLNDEQVQNLADMMGVTVDEMLQMEIQIDTEAENLITAISPDGIEVNLGELLDIENGGKLIDTKNAINKIANALGIEKAQAEKMVAELNLESIELHNMAEDKRKLDSEMADPSAKKNGDKFSPFLRKDAAEAQVLKNEQAEKLQKEISNNNESAESAQGLDEIGESLAGNGSSNSGSGTGNGGASSFQHQEILAQKADTAEIVDFAAVKENVKQANLEEAKFVQKSFFNKEAADKILNQIVDKAKLMAFPNHTEARLNLSPGHLGSVDIKIVIQDAQVKGHIVVENQQVKQLLEQNMDSLKSAIGEQGISLDEMSVEVNQGQAQFNNDSESRELGKIGGSRIEFATDENRQEKAVETERARRAARNSTVYVTA